MATTAVNVTRQTVLYAERNFTSDDFAANAAGHTKPLIYLKPGTRILRGAVDITTAFQGSGTITASVGDTEGSTPSVNRWKTAYNVKATGITPLVASLADSDLVAAEGITLTVASSGTLTGGAGRISIEFIESPNRSTEFNTYRG
jgi:hypothetical protein